LPDFELEVRTEEDEFRLMRRLINPCPLGPGANEDTGGVMDGVIPKTMVMGLMMGADGRDIGPIRRSRTADNK
jgi:hypothetical protein